MQATQDKGANITITAGDIFECAMAQLDELDNGGSVYSDATERYAKRAAKIVTSLAEEGRALSGKIGEYGILDDLEDTVEDIDEAYAIGVMPYGLAAALIIDENPATANFLEARYEEMRDRYFVRMRAKMDESIEDLYGGIEYGQFGSWA